MMLLEEGDVILKGALSFGILELELVKLLDLEITSHMYVFRG